MQQLWLDLSTLDHQAEVCQLHKLAECVFVERVCIVRKYASDSEAGCNVLHVMTLGFRYQSWNVVYSSYIS